MQQQLITLENFKELKFPEHIISHCTIEPSWGASIYMMYMRDGIAVGYGRLYWLNDDKYTIYLEGLHVYDDYRKHGIGLVLQEFRESVGKLLGASQVCLWVKKDSWMHDWYIRRGYKFYREHDEEPESVWMVKQL